MGTAMIADTAETWLEEARKELLQLKGPAGFWGYRRGARASVEPTSLACLGLLSVSQADGLNPSEGAIASAADWLVSIQSTNGSLGLAEGLPEPGWPTASGLLLWSAMAGRTEPKRRAANWLLAQKGRTIPKADDADRIVGHDTTLIGWPWVTDTHSWLEPTAMSVLALRRAGHGRHARVAEGIRLIRDRAINGGGWNYGNKAVFGRSLRPQPAPTGLALLALAGVESRSKTVDRAIRYLIEVLPQTRAPASLSWGLLGLRAWAEEPADSRSWLAESFGRTTGKAEAAPRLAVLMLAAGTHALEILFDESERGVRHE